MQLVPNHQRWYAIWKAQLEYNTRCIHVFAHLAPICMLSRCLLTKLVHRSSVGSLLRVHLLVGYTVHASKIR